MIEGQEQPAMIATPWHPKWMSQLIDNAGWIKAMDLLSYTLSLTPENQLADKIPKSFLLNCRTQNITIRALNKNDVETEGEILRQLYNEAWQHNWGFVPLVPLEIKIMIQELRPILRPEYFVLVEIDGHPAGVALLLPNLFDICHDVAGKPSIWGWIKFLWRLILHTFHSGRIILLGISSKWQKTVLGAMLPGIIISELMQRAHHTPF